MSRADNDFYKTPPDVAEALLCVERFPVSVHEPACGDGMLSKVLLAKGHDVSSTDLVDRGYGISGIDFLACKRRVRESEALITNPPFSLSDEFAIHALELGYDKIALLAPLTWLAGGKRRTSLWLKYPASRVWVFSSRKTLWRGDQVRPDKSNSGKITYAWFVWERGHAPGPIGWLP
jgi:hypothetical protein